MNDNAENDPRLYAIPDIHGHAKGEHKAFTDERPIPLSARMLFLWFYHACRRGWPRFMMVTDHMNYLTFEDPAAINLVRRALKLAQAGDLYGAAETASVEVGHAAVVSEGLRRGMHYSIGAEVDNDPRSRPDAQNIVDAMKPDGMIRSVHFLTIDHPSHGPNWNWPFDNPEFADVFEIVGTAKTWELYMATLLDAVERLPGNILGHFYVPAVFGHWPDDATLGAYEDQIVDACEARGMAIEFNTRFLYRDHPPAEKEKYLAAYRRLLVKCKVKNVGIAVGSDAHSPKDQGRAFQTVLALLDECEINELVFPIAGRLARVALRVERKPEVVAAVSEVAATAAEERKAVRKPRTSDAPSRPKEASSRRDDAEADEAPPADDAPAAKSKPRPKRGKSRPAESSAASSGWETSDGPADAPPPDVTAADGAPAEPRDVARFNGERPHVTPTVPPPADPPADAPVADAEASPAAPDEPVSEAAPDTPASSDAAATRSVATASASTEPAATESAATEPAATESAASEPAATESAATEFAASEPAATESAATESAASESAATESAASESAATELAATEPAVNDPASTEPLVRETQTHGDVVPDDVSPEITLADARAHAVTRPVAARSGAAAAPAAPRRSVAAQAVRKVRPKPVATAKSKSAKAKASAVKTKPAAKKTAKPAAKSVAKKAATKKSGAKKSVAKKVTPKKAAAKKAAPKKVAARATAAKKSAGKKPPGKKTAAKKPASKRR